jgi:hypothetical protein
MKTAAVRRKKRRRTRIIEPTPDITPEEDYHGNEGEEQKEKETVLCIRDIPEDTATAIAPPNTRSLVCALANTCETELNAPLRFMLLHGN